MRLPTFLIIGAMRAGTTTLATDLASHPQIFMPHWKEPAALDSDDVLSESGKRSYARLFRDARPGQACGEASTAYTKMPTVTGVPERARKLLGADLKHIYLVREPVGRCRSQHHHERGNQITRRPLVEAVREEPHFIDYSRYAMQLEPWLEHYPPEQFTILRFEDYVADRNGTVRQLCRFLGVDPDALPSIDENAAFNKTANRPSTTPFWRTYVNGTAWYEVHVKPRVPYRARRWLAEQLLPKAPPEADPLDPETTAYLVHELADDTDRFERLFHRLWPEAYNPGRAYEIRERYGVAPPKEVRGAEA